MEVSLAVIQFQSALIDECHVGRCLDDSTHVVWQHKLYHPVLEDHPGPGGKDVTHRLVVIFSMAEPKNRIRRGTETGERGRRLGHHFHPHDHGRNEQHGGGGQERISDQPAALTGKKQFNRDDRHVWEARLRDALILQGTVQGGELMKEHSSLFAIAQFLIEMGRLILLQSPVQQGENSELKVFWKILVHAVCSLTDRSMHSRRTVRVRIRETRSAEAFRPVCWA
jgi:hypothetical protein